MSRDRDYLLRDGVLFDAHNLNETATHCWVRNRYLQGLATTAVEARELLLTLVLEHVAREQYHLGQMAPAYNAWFVVDGYDSAQPYTPPGTDQDETASIRLEVNFFVRPGREPILRDASP